MSKKAPLTGLLHEELEPRLLFSAGLEAVLVDDNLSGPESAIVETISEEQTEILQLETIQQDSEQTEPAREVVFIDENVPDYDQLMADLADKDNIDIYILDSSVDGVEQISAVLENYQGLEAIHLVSHGDEQGLYLGNGTLDNTTIDSYAETITGWQSALSEQADLLIYGCDVADGEQGLALLDKLNTLTGTDIAASDDRTGHAELGGDWTFEYRQGELESSVVFSTTIQNNWQGVLAPTISSLDGDTANYTEGDAATVIEQLGDVSVSKSGGFYNTLTISITAGGDAAEDVLAIRNQGTGAGQIGISGANVTYEGATIGTFSGGSGGTDLVISFSSGTDTNVAALIENVSYENTDSSTATLTSRTIEFTLTQSGAGGGSDSATTTVNVADGNALPTAVNNTVTTNEDNSYTFTAADFNYSDGDGDPMASIEVTSLESVGSLKLSGVDVTLNQVISKADIDAGNLTFIPVTNASGSSYDSFAFSVNDGTGDSSSSYTMTVDVNAVNDTPTASINTVTTNEDTSYTFSAADFNYYDIDGDSMASVKITSLESVGVLKWYDGGTWQDVTLNQVISKADVDAGYLKFTPAANANGATHDVFSFSVNDGAVDSTATFTMTIDVNAVNDSPTLSNIDGDILAYAEGDGAVILDQGTAAALGDIDSTDFDTGTLTVSIPTGNDPAEDVLTINNQGTGAGQTGVSGSDVTYEGTIIGSFAGGSSGSNLVITFNSNATPTAVQSLVQNICFENTDASTATIGTRVVRFALTDGDGGSSGNHDVTVNVSDVSSVPSVSSLTGDTLSYTEGDGAVVIEQGTDVTVSDGGVGEDFSSGDLTVGFSVNGVSSEDVLSVNNQGTGAGQIGFDGTNVTYEGGVIGTATGGSSGVDFVITFANSPSEAAVSALMENISYENTNTDNPNTASRTVSYILTNNVSASTTNTATVDVAAVNDAPVNTIQDSAVSQDEDTTIIFNAANSNLVSISDVDAGTMQISLSVSNGTLSLSGTGGLTFSSGDGTSDSTMIFTGSAANINAALDGMNYTPNLNWNGSDTLNLTTSDLGGTGTGGTLTDTDSVAITINPINDAPTASSNTVTTTEDIDHVFSSADFSFSDVDGDTMSSVKITTLENVGNLQLSGVDVTLNQVITKADIDAGKLTFTPVPAASGVAYDSFGFSVNDASTDSVATYTMTIDVNPANDAPTISGTPANTITAGNNYSFTPSSNDTDGDALIFSVSNLPAWASFNTSTGEISGTPSDSAAGTYSNIVISVNDGTETVSLASFDITVKQENTYYPEVPDITVPSITPDDPIEEVTETETEDIVSEEENITSEENIIETDVEVDTDKDGKTTVLLKQGSQELLHALTANQTSADNFNIITAEDLANEENILIESVSPWQLDSNGISVDLQNALDELNKQLGSDGSAEKSNDKIIVTTAAGVTIGLTAGFVTWALQGSSLLTALLTTLPAWNTFDPLPVLNQQKNKKDVTADGEQDRDGVDSVFADFASDSDE